VTFEILEEKADLARKTFSLTEVDGVIELINDDALNHISAYTNIAFCFLDSEKEMYLDCYEAIVPRLVPGGLLVADNAINHRNLLVDFLERASSDNRVDSLIVPIGKGELICRKK
jgi:predicted O-methyltransferase YrrM